MLQQTTVATVIPRFRRFVERWPTVEALAAAPRRGRAAANGPGLAIMPAPATSSPAPGQVAARGGFPDTEAELRELPGLGAYTAAAIAAIAFGERGGGDRHQCRAGGRPAPRHRAPDRRGPRRDPRSSPTAMTPADRPGDFAQAMMDLGATICRPQKPDCAACPLSDDCRAFASGDARSLSRAQGQARAPAPPRHRLVDRARRRGVAGAAPGQGTARRDGGAARAGLGRRAARRAGARHGRATASPISRSTCTVVARAEPPPARAGGSRSTGSPRRACRRSTAARSRRCSPEGTPLAA